MSVLLGVLLVLGGGVWVAQGLNLPWAPGSFMTADPLWVVIGAGTMGLGLILVVRGLRARSGRGGTSAG
jgi:hypothetical protein